MRIGLIAGLLGVIVAIAAVVTTAGPIGIYIAAGMIFLFSGMFLLFYKLFFQQLLLSARLQKNGIPGKAKILEVKDTGITINNNPQVKLLLEVKNNLGMIYNASCRVLVSRLNPGMYQPGMEVPVKIDPKDDKKLVIDLTQNKPKNPF